MLFLFLRVKKRPLVDRFSLFFLIEGSVVFSVYPAEKERHGKRPGQIDEYFVIEVINQELEEESRAEPGENTARRVLGRPVKEPGTVSRFMSGEVPHTGDGKNGAGFILHEADVEMSSFYEAEKEGGGYHHQPQQWDETSFFFTHDGSSFLFHGGVEFAFLF